MITLPPPVSGWSTSVVAPPFTLQWSELTIERIGGRFRSHSPDSDISVGRIAVGVVQRDPMGPTSTLHVIDSHRTTVTYYKGTTIQRYSRGCALGTHRGTQLRGRQRRRCWIVKSMTHRADHSQPRTTSHSRWCKCLRRREANLRKTVRQRLNGGRTKKKHTGVDIHIPDIGVHNRRGAAGEVERVPNVPTAAQEVGAPAVTHVDRVGPEREVERVLRVPRPSRRWCDVLLSRPWARQRLQKHSVQHF